MASPDIAASVKFGEALDALILLFEPSGAVLTAADRKARLDDMIVELIHRTRHLAEKRASIIAAIRKGG